MNEAYGKLLISCLTFDSNIAFVGIANSFIGFILVYIFRISIDKNKI